jgi:hypothetical protein
MYNLWPVHEPYKFLIGNLFELRFLHVEKHLLLFCTSRCVRLSRQCGILNISQPYRPPRPVTGELYYRTK